MTQHSRWLASPLKRAIDIVGSLAGIVVGLVPMTALHLVVAVRVGRPALFRQQRAGQGGQPISVLKFRTMTDERDEKGTLASDEVRLTPLGRRLRAWSLDELPQLFSVLRGDMSLVGPRPLPLTYVDRYSDRQRRRLDARPGLTGWSQINGRNSPAWPVKLEHDVWYVENATFWLDLRIMMATIRAVGSGSGVSAAGHVTMPEFLGEQATAPSEPPS